MAAPFQCLVHFIQQNIARERRQRPALRRPLIRLLHHAIAHDPAVQIGPNQPDNSGVADTFL